MNTQTMQNPEANAYHIVGSNKNDPISDRYESEHERVKNFYAKMTLAELLKEKESLMQQSGHLGTYKELNAVRLAILNIRKAEEEKKQDIANTYGATANIKTQVNSVLAYTTETKKIQKQTQGFVQRLLKSLLWSSENKSYQHGAV